MAITCCHDGQPAAALTDSVQRLTTQCSRWSCNRDRLLSRGGGLDGQLTSAGPSAAHHPADDNSVIDNEVLASSIDRLKAMTTERHPTTLELHCPSCSGTAFDLRVLADEGVAAARCVSCASHYLVLDSEVYWFDLIQASYPRLRRCSCKASSFTLSCHYVYRIDGDVRQVDLLSVCTSCAKATRQMTVDVDYGDTDSLITQPLRPCKKPDLRVDLREVSLYVTPANIAAVIDYLSEAHGYVFVCWRREEEHWVRRPLGTDEVRQAVLSNRYLHLYASAVPLEIHDHQVDSSRREAAFWKRQDVIRITSPINMRVNHENGLLYYLQFANEYVEDDVVVPKQANFRATTQALLQSLGDNFVSWRGKSSFDNPAEHLRLFGDRFSKNKPADRHRPEGDSPLGDAKGC